MFELKKDYTVNHRDPQHATTARASDYTSFFYLGNLIEYDKTSNIFQNAEIAPPTIMYLVTLDKVK